MDPSAELHLLRAENELITAQILFEISQNMQLQKEQFKLERQFTFYSATISHAFYSILLSVDWDKQLPFYHVMLSYDEKWIFMTINANTGKIMERQIKTRKISDPD